MCQLILLIQMDLNLYQQVNYYLCGILVLSCAC